MPHPSTKDLITRTRSAWLSLFILTIILERICSVNHKFK
jgi:hypothetical protein